MNSIEPEICPYCHHDNTRYVTGYVDDNEFIEQYCCSDCDEYYEVVYEFANPRYREA